MSSDDSSINPDDVPLEVEDINIIPPFKMEYNMNDFEKKLKKLDYEIMEFNPNDTIDVVEADLAIYKECMKMKHPKYHIFNKIKVCKNSQQHGKEFERNMKILISLLVSKERNPDAILARVTDKKTHKFNNTDKKLQITRDNGSKTVFGAEDEDYPLTEVFFLPHTEHQNDEKDIDTNQLLTSDTQLQSYFSRLSENPIYNITKKDDISEGVRSHWWWKFAETAAVRELATKWFGSGINIKCAKTDGKIHKWKGKNTYLPKAIDCAKSTTFYNETMKDEDWIFAIGVWEQKGDVKCIKGVWFIKMTKEDHQKIWGYEGDSPEEKQIFGIELFEEIKTFQNKINNLSRFNNQPWKKLLHYYGSISKVKKRLLGKDYVPKKYNSATDKWEKEKGPKQPCWDEDILESCVGEKGNIFDGGCLNLHNKIKSMFKANKSTNKKKSLIAISPKVQGTEPQNRVQCSMTKTNFKKFLNAKKEGDVIWCDAKNYPFLCKPITSSSRELSGGGQKGGMFNMRKHLAAAIAPGQNIWDRLDEDDDIDIDIYNDNNGETYLYNVEDNTICTNEDGKNEIWKDIDTIKQEKQDWIQQDEYVKQDVDIIDSNVIHNAMLEELRDKIELVVEEQEKMHKTSVIFLDGQKTTFKQGKTEEKKRRSGAARQQFQIGSILGSNWDIKSNSASALRLARRHEKRRALTEGVLHIEGSSSSDEDVQPDNVKVRSLSASNLYHVDQQTNKLSPKGKNVAGAFVQNEEGEFVPVELEEDIEDAPPSPRHKKLTIKKPVAGKKTSRNPSRNPLHVFSPTSSTTSSVLHPGSKQRTGVGPGSEDSAFKGMTTGVSSSWDSTATHNTDESDLSSKTGKMSISDDTSSKKSDDGKSVDSIDTNTSLGGKKKKRRKKRTRKKRKRKKKTRARR